MSAEKLRELKTLASVCPELNMANYTEDDVRHLNDWAIEMSLLVEQYALSQQPAQPAQAPQAEVTDSMIREAFLANGFTIKDGHSDLKPYVYAAARAILALRPERVPMTPREIELIDGMIAVQLDHAQRCDAISNRAMAEKQKGWDMERVELLRRIRSFGITAQEGTNGEIN